MVLVLLLSFGGTYSRLGAQKPPLVRILPSHSGVKKTKQKSLDHKCIPMVLVLLLFWGGTHSRLGAQKPPLVRILPSHLGVKKTKQKGLDHKCTPMVLVLLLSFGGTQFSLTWGGHNSRLGVTVLTWGSQFSLGGHGPEMTTMAPGLHGCLCRKFTALVS